MLVSCFKNNFHQSPLAQGQARSQPSRPLAPGYITLLPGSEPCNRSPIHPPLILSTLYFALSFVIVFVCTLVWAKSIVDSVLGLPW